MCGKYLLVTVAALNRQCERGNYVALFLESLVSFRRLYNYARAKIPMRFLSTPSWIAHRPNRPLYALVLSIFGLAKTYDPECRRISHSHHAGDHLSTIPSSPL